jgi:two-component system, OmpR family, sensor kinase
MLRIHNQKPKPKSPSPKAQAQKPMLKTLHGKIAAALGALLLLIALALVPLTFSITRISRQEITQLVNRDLAANLAAEKILVQNGRTSRAAMQNVTTTLTKLHPGTQAYLLSPQGEILAAPDNVSALPKRVNVEPIQRFLRGEKLPILGDDPSDGHAQRIFSASPLKVNNRLEGYVYVILETPEIESFTALIARSYALQLRLLAIGGVLLCALGMGLLLFSQLTRRLTRLAQAMDDFEKNDFRGALPLPGASGDEIDRLGAIFTGMAGRIEQQIEELRRADALRREMVSNASHDLRTPLAALRGYLETLLLREGRMTPDEQRAYLKIALKHGERLSALVDELFELAKLDALQIEPRAEPFLLNELLQDVAQKYQLIAENKGVTLRTAMKSTLFVHADIALIERVLENLIENALRHTPPGGSVALELSSHENRVRVRVADTGSGIAAEELPRIFDRFYRGEESGANPQSGAGLGLAIARRILELHGSTISAQSVPGEGTVFTFDLPAASLE